jgi:hypothetical protein
LGTFWISMSKRVLSASTEMRCTLRSTAGSSQISMRARSGPTLASATAAAVLSLSGKARAASRAEPSKIFIGREIVRGSIPRSRSHA